MGDVVHHLPQFTLCLLGLGKVEELCSLTAIGITVYYCIDRISKVPQVITLLLQYRYTITDI